MTENCNSLDSIKKNHPYLSATFENMASPQAISGRTMRGRLIAANNNLGTRNHLFLLLLSADFPRIMGNMNKTFQDPTKSLSKLMEITNQTVKIIEQSRTDAYWEIFFRMSLKHCDLISFVEKPASSNAPRRRLRHDHKEVQIFFQLSGVEKCDKVNCLRSICNGKNTKVKVLVNTKHEMCSIPSMFLVKNDL